MEAIKEIQELIPVLLFLLPGFLSAKIVQLLIIVKPKDTFDRIIEALVFTLINLTVFMGFRWLLELVPKIKFDHEQFFTAGNLSLIFACSVGIGLLCSYELRNEKLLEWLRKWKLTKKTYKPSTWAETFYYIENFVVVHLNDGRRVYGWVRFYSDEFGERAVFLEKASWLGDKNELLNDPPISILLDDKSGIQLIEFISKRE